MGGKPPEKHHQCAFLFFLLHSSIFAVFTQDFPPAPGPISTVHATAFYEGGKNVGLFYFVLKVFTIHKLQNDDTECLHNVQIFT